LRRGIKVVWARRIDACGNEAVSQTNDEESTGMSEARFADDQHQISRRTLLAAAAAFAVPAAVYGDSANQNATTEARMPDTKSTWPHGARLAVSFSLMFEAGGQPISGAGGVIPDPIQQGLPD
jgi:hypothetical protein